MPSRGFWAWIPDFMGSETASGDRASPANISHAQGRTDSYRPSYHDDLIRNGVLPPARGSGSRIFRSTRRTSPNKRRATQTNGPNRVSKPTSKKTSPVASTRRERAKLSQPQTKRPEAKTRHPAARKQNGQFAKFREASIKRSSPPPNAPKAPLADHVREKRSVKASSPPPNAPKAPLADRLNDMDSLFSNLDVADTPLPVLRAPFRDHISSDSCMHPTCPVGEPHEEGLYLHEGRLAEGPHNYFGANNPPPWLWEAYKRVEASEASEMDFVNLQYFISCHLPRFDLCKESFGFRL
ncbi:MAG: hypothetical protein Q9195_004981 [Heterodermia aff. obscurata]